MENPLAAGRDAAVIRFWFEEASPSQWFARDDRFDEQIRTRFETWIEPVAAAPMEAFATTAASLAAVIVLDQFPRNAYRNSPRAFATDRRALAQSRFAMGCGLDRQLHQMQRVFLYMPFQHAEDRVTQAESVALFSAVGHAESADSAREHRNIIERFGRFPHRNAVLGRQSTPEELEFLKTHRGF